MTFKHVKFEDSVTMRSLERVARDKGWLPPVKSLSKIASLNETDLSISVNLTENIMKLCSGLRASGLDKYADDVESKFMSYKSAQTLYETSKEKDEDLVDAAHPKGSHKLTDMDGDNVIETIIDQHLAGIKLTEKKPTGKLASNKDILRSVKIVLAQAANPTIVQNLNIVLNSVQTIFVLHEDQSFLTRPIASGKDTLINYINQAISNAGNPSSLERILPMIKLGLDSFYSAFKPGTIIGGVPNETWAGMTSLFAKANTALGTIQKALSEPAAAAPKVASQLNILNKWLGNAFSVLKGFQAKIATDPDLEDAEKKQANQWISAKMNQVQGVKAQLEGMEDEEKEQNASILLGNLKKITTPSFSEFKSNWID
jgi:hypothetical protein